MNPKKSWMYARLKEGLLNPDFLWGIDEFLKFAKMYQECMDEIKLYVSL